jgi:hypothetical protein
MPVPVHHQHHPPTPTNAVQERYGSDLMNRDTAFIYPVTIEKDSLGKSVQVYDPTPYPLRCSFQEHALNSEHVEPDKYGSRFANVFTRFRATVKWYDILEVRGIRMRVEDVEEKFDNFDGSFHHVEIRAVYLKENESINFKTAPAK